MIVRSLYRNGNLVLGSASELLIILLCSTSISIALRLSVRKCYTINYLAFSRNRKLNINNRSVSVVKECLIALCYKVEYIVAAIGNINLSNRLTLNSVGKLGYLIKVACRNLVICLSNYYCVRRTEINDSSVSLYTNKAFADNINPAASVSSNIDRVNSLKNLGCRGRWLGTREACN